MDNVKIIAVPLMGKSTDCKISKLFARSPYFMIFNGKSENIEFVKNNYKDDKTQSGKHISKLLVAKGVNVFCGNDIGFNVQKIAEENNIQLIVLPEKEIILGNTVINIIKNREK